MMTEVTIFLKNIKALSTFVNIARLQHEDADIVSGNYCVDAKSQMGLFCFDLTKPLTLRIHSDDAEDYLNAIKEFIVETPVACA